MKIALNGYKGKMGLEITRFIKAHPSYNLVAGIGRDDDLKSLLEESSSDILTNPKTRMKIVETSLRLRIPIVTGTSGFEEKDLKKIQEWVDEFSTGCFIAPNFIIGNVLMQKFAEQASFYYDNVEIIEYHHEQKVDYPSGTAIKTAELMTKNKKKFNLKTRDQFANIQGSRGGDFKGIKIHSVRMPGFIASQKVLLGDDGEYLTIRHDNIHRKSYMKGIFMAVDYIFNNPKLVYGLENIL